jgi:hypothetical protein
VGSSGRAIKNTGNMSSLMGRPEGNIGRPDGARANALSPFFSRGAFRGVRTGCERTSNGLRTEHSGFSTGVLNCIALVPEFGISVWQDVGLIFMWFGMILSSKDAVPGFTNL